MPSLRIQELIEAKRDGAEHTAAEMYALILGFARGEVPDYQMSAWLMAVTLRGLTRAETVSMTEAMVRSGSVMDLSAIPGVKVDKHSTGGVGDTTTLVLAPLVASCGVRVAKLSGRGLGHTGGTLDKLEAIPGFSVDMSAERLVAQVKRVGCAVAAQSADIDPADKLIYRLRDVTGTVPSIPLIVASIISKKVAGGADAVVLDVKVGSGAFMKSRDEAKALAAELIAVGEELRLRVAAVVSDMSQPLGSAIGNALEVREAIEVLKGTGSPDLRELSLALGVKMLVLGDAAASESEARTALEGALESGAALRVFREWVAAQGGDPGIVEDPAILPRSDKSRVVRASADGFVAAFDAEMLGRVAMTLGAGRARLGDAIDHAAGVQLLRRIGAEVSSGEPLAMLYAAEEPLLAAGEERFLSAVSIAPVAPQRGPLVEDV